MRRATPAAVAALLLGGCGSADRPDLVSAAQRAGGELYSQPYSLGIGVHTEKPVNYATNPPTNGPHAGRWAEDGNYAGVDPPRVEEIVHAQEHGRIVIWYRRGLPAEQVAALERLYDEDPRHVLLVESRSDMDCDVAVTAWAHGMKCRRFLGEATLDALRAFRDTYRDKGPERLA